MTEALRQALSSPFFGVALCVFAYMAGQRVAGKIRSPLANPLLIAIVLIVVFLKTAGISLNDYDKGASLLTLMLTPATAALAVSIYRRRGLLRENLLPVVAGCFAGAATSMGSTWLLCRLFGLDETLTASMMPRSVTTPIAMEIARDHGGIVPLTVAAVIFTGILGAVFAPILIRKFRIDDPVAAGVAIGASSHGIGTAKALELGETEGAMSGIAIGVTGIATVVLFALL